MLHSLSTIVESLSKLRFKSKFCWLELKRTRWSDRLCFPFVCCTSCCSIIFQNTPHAIVFTALYAVLWKTNHNFTSSTGIKRVSSCQVLLICELIMETVNHIYKSCVLAVCWSGTFGCGLWHLLHTRCLCFGSCVALSVLCSAEADWRSNCSMSYTCVQWAQSQRSLLSAADLTLHVLLRIAASWSFTFHALPHVHAHFAWVTRWQTRSL